MTSYYFPQEFKNLSSYMIHYIKNFNVFHIRNKIRIFSEYDFEVSWGRIGQIWSFRKKGVQYILRS